MFGINEMNLSTHKIILEILMVFAKIDHLSFSDTNWLQYHEKISTSKRSTSDSSSDVKSYDIERLEQLSLNFKNGEPQFNIYSLQELISVSETLLSNLSSTSFLAVLQLKFENLCQ